MVDIDMGDVESAAQLQNSINFSHKDFSSSSSTSASLEQDFQFSSDLEEEEDDDQLEKLRRICASERFNIREEDRSEDKFQNQHFEQTGSNEKSKKKHKRRNRNKFVIFSSSEYFTEDVDITTGEEEGWIWPDPNTDQEFLKQWQHHWASEGESILWRTWNEKYKDFINLEYDLVEHLKTVPICSDSSSSSSDQEDDDHMESVKIRLSEATRQMLKRRKEEKKDEKVELDAGRDEHEAWQQTWDAHCQEEHNEEYQKYVKKHFKMRKLSVTDENAKINSGIRKYYAQRYQLFSKYDEGIKLDFESWFSVTPEEIAIHIAQKFSLLGSDIVILDAFAGCGGNTIQFAKICDKVIAVDIDPVKIENCRHNAKIYGVEEKIDFIVGDFMELAPTLKADAVFLSPPWGGPGYQCNDVFDIETMIPMNGVKLFETAQTISHNISYFLPRNVDKNQVIKLAGDGNYVEIERNFHNDRVKTVTAYYGNLTRRPIAKTVAE